MPYLFSPPYVREPHGGGHRLFAAVGVYRGVSLLVTAGAVSEVRYPTIEQQRAADFVYLGGHIYTVSDDEARVLIGAGYVDSLARIDAYSDLYENTYGGDLVPQEG